VVALKIAGIIILALLMIGALGTVIIGLPGTWIVFLLAIIASAIGGFKQITFWILLLLFGLAVLGEILEFLFGYFGTRKMGASKKASWSALICGILGAIFLSGIVPIIGTIIGAFVGAFLGAFLIELVWERKWREALNAGISALVGRLSSVVSKIAVGSAMIVITISQLV